MQKINIIGTRTLCKREIWRFMKVWNQTLIAPVITTLIFLAIMSLALGGHAREIDGIPYEQFIAPGLIMMAIVQNAFANTSSSLMLSKIQGVIVDILTPPLTGAEITFSLVAGGVVRGMLVGLSVSIAVYMVVQFPIEHPFFALFHVMAASVMMALLGVLTGVWAQSFDQVASVTNYLITPLAFLSGTFYPIKSLPEVWYIISHFDPLFYMIDGFRYALLGYSDSSPMLGFSVMMAANIALWAIIQYMITRGYRLKS